MSDVFSMRAQPLRGIERVPLGLELRELGSRQKSANEEEIAGSVEDSERR